MPSVAAARSILEGGSSCQPYPALSFFPQLTDCFAVAPARENRGPGNEDARPLGGGEGCGVVGDSTVDLEIDRAPRSIDHAPDRTHFGQDRGDEWLSSEPRVDAHHKDEVDQADHIPDRLLARSGVEDDA